MELELQKEVGNSTTMLQFTSSALFVSRLPRLLQTSTLRCGVAHLYSGYIAQYCTILDYAALISSSIYPDHILLKKMPVIKFVIIPLVVCCGPIALPTPSSPTSFYLSLNNACVSLPSMTSSPTPSTSASAPASTSSPSSSLSPSALTSLPNRLFGLSPLMNLPFTAE